MTLKHEILSNAGLADEAPPAGGADAAVERLKTEIDSSHARGGAIQDSDPQLMALAMAAARRGNFGITRMVAARVIKAHIEAFRSASRGDAVLRKHRMEIVFDHQLSVELDGTIRWARWRQQTWVLTDASSIDEPATVVSVRLNGWFGWTGTVVAVDGPEDASVHGLKGSRVRIAARRPARSNELTLIPVRRWAHLRGDFVEIESVAGWLPMRLTSIARPGRDPGLFPNYVPPVVEVPEPGRDPLEIPVESRSERRHLLGRLERQVERISYIRVVAADGRVIDRYVLEVRRPRASRRGQTVRVCVELEDGSRRSGIARLLESGEWTDLLTRTQFTTVTPVATHSAVLIEAFQAARRAVARGEYAAGNGSSTVGQVV